MKYSIIGTAGHVDHGKTALIKALTGIETSRLREEKERGITIELGFAGLDLPDGGKAGIIDVPGHEKFIKNMLAGAGGMDLVLLVIAADEGIMPQTTEHLDILSLLNIRSGIIVLTKTDMVDDEWIEMVEEDIRSEVRGTFLENAPVMRVSSKTGEGIEELRQTIFEKLAHTDRKNKNLPMRIPVDRVFSMEGFGTVITGTLIEGTLCEGDEVMIYPAGISAKARNIQVHSAPVKKAFAGQRSAVNLSGIKKQDVKRGDCLAAPGSLKQSLMIDVKLKALAHCERELLNGSRLHFYHGTGDCLCKLVLLNRDSVKKGEEAFAQLRFTEPIAVKNGDHFVVRFYSPVETVGGGVILDSLPQRHKRYDEAVLKNLTVKESGTAEDRILQRFIDAGVSFTPNSEIFSGLGIDRQEFESAVRKFSGSGELTEITPQIFIHKKVFDETEARFLKILDEYHKRNPLRAGMKKEELRSRLLPRCDAALANSLLEIFYRNGKVKENGQYVRKSDFSVQYSPSQKKLFDILNERFLKENFETSSVDEIKLQYAGEKELKIVLEAMGDSGCIVFLTPQIVMHHEAYEHAKTMLVDFCRENGEISLPQFRDLIGSSRKYALALLEYFDRRGLTRKSGDARILIGQK